MDIRPPPPAPTRDRSVFQRPDNSSANVADLAREGSRPEDASIWARVVPEAPATATLPRASSSSRFVWRADGQVADVAQDHRVGAGPDLVAPAPRVAQSARPAHH